MVNTVKWRPMKAKAGKRGTRRLDEIFVNNSKFIYKTLIYKIIEIHK